MKIWNIYKYKEDKHISTSITKNNRIDEDEDLNS